MPERENESEDAPDAGLLESETAIRALFRAEQALQEAQRALEQAMFRARDAAMVIRLLKHKVKDRP